MPKMKKSNSKTNTAKKDFLNKNKANLNKTRQFIEEHQSKSLNTTENQRAPCFHSH